MPIKKEVYGRRRLFSLIVTVMFVLSSIWIFFPLPSSTVSASSVSHNIGNLKVYGLNDYGSIRLPIQWQGTYQSTIDTSAITYIGLVIDQDNYNHIPGSIDIADCFGTYSYGGQDDFQRDINAKMIIDDGTAQKSMASYQNKGTADPNDIYINQTAWSVKDKDWFIIQWRLINIKGADITGVCLGLELSLSQVGSGIGGGLGGDSGDDVDGYDFGSATYYVQDNGGSSTCFGFASAIVSEPITHYYSNDYNTTFDKTTYENETWLYERLHMPNTVVGGASGNRTSTVGWNDFIIPAGSSKTFTLVMAINDTFDDMITAVEDARQYYRYKATGFRITEFSDSSSGIQRIEVFNFGRETTDLSKPEYSISVNGGTLTGTWVNNPVPTYEHAVFTRTGGSSINAEGDTIKLYENGVVADEISFGQMGIAPDPLNGESVARRYDPQIVSYTDYWLRNASSGPTWGSQNDVNYVVSMPQVVLNEVMFNPSVDPDGRFIVILNKNPVVDVNVSNYSIVCNDFYQLPTILPLGPNEMLIIEYSDASTLFQNMGSQGDNVYLYDNNGNLLDMVGWNSPHLQGMRMKRAIDGSGTHQGYDDITSEATGWVFDCPLQVNITEISDSESAVSQIEVYNPSCPLVDFRVGFTFDDYTGSVNGAWSIPIVGPNGYAVFDVDVTTPLDPEGDTLTLYQNNVLIEEISYGQKGVVPDPLPNESVQRYWNGSTYTDSWERNYTTGPNFGAQNDVPNANFSSLVVLNEVLFYPSSPSDRFVEIYYLGDSDINISGYKIVCDSEYIVSDGTILDVDDPNFYLINNMKPTFFSSMDSLGDNVYLYDANGSLLDMVGWNSRHTIGRTVCRIPEGNGTRNGYNDLSSMIAGWRFDQSPSIHLIQIGPDSNEYGDRGDSIMHNLTIVNKHGNDDLVDVSNISSPWGWDVILLDENGLPLTDSNGNGLPDIFVPADDLVNITVVVMVPINHSLGDNETTLITVRSTFNSLFADSAMLISKVSPYIIYNKTASPTQINILGTGHGEETIITLSALGAGNIVKGEVSNAADIIFVVDDTGSMSGVLGQLKNVILDIMMIFQMKIESLRLGLITYKDFPEWDLILTFNINDFVRAVNALASEGGFDWPEDVYGALDLAINAPWRPGNVSKLIILIGDAEDHDPYSPCPLVERAYRNQWGIYTSAIACSEYGPWMPDTFMAIAENGSGVYDYYDASMDPEELANTIIEMVLTLVQGMDIAAKDLDISDGNPMIRDVLPDYIHYVNGSASIDPDTYYIDGDGNTVLEWNVTQIIVNETWEVSFSVTSSRLGLQLANIVSDSRINYTKWDDREITVYFPEVWIDVHGIPSPPRPRVNVVSGTNHIRLEWDPPFSQGITHYLIYRTTNSPVSFDFSSPSVDTSSYIDPIGLDINGARTSWNFTNDVINAKEIYYCVRAVNSIGQKSTTSYTVGKWTKTFPQGISSFSLPLKPVQGIDTYTFINDMGANYIKWMDSGTHVWRQHNLGDPIGVNNTNMILGEGYEVKFDSQVTYTFSGMPGGMISYQDNIGFSGFDWVDEAKTLIVSIKPDGDVDLTWQEPASMGMGDLYKVYYSDTRDGFFGTFGIDYHLACPIINFGTNTATHNGAYAHDPGARLYYMVVPFNASGIRGASTYSIGIWTEEYQPQYDTLGIPLRLKVYNTADWFCDNIPDTVGINYYNISSQKWRWHSTRMSEGAYDPVLEMTEGYLISTSAATKYAFIGI